MRTEVITVLPVVLNVVEKDGLYLLVEEAKPVCRHQWHLPGGALNPGEGLGDGAKRECLEEAGIEIEPLGVMSFQRITPQQASYQERWRFIVCARVVGGTLKQQPDEESLCARWYRVEDLTAIQLRNPSTLELIRYHATRPALLPMSAFDLRVE